MHSLRPSDAASQSAGLHAVKIRHTVRQALYWFDHRPDRDRPRGGVRPEGPAKCGGATAVLGGRNVRTQGSVTGGWFRYGDGSTATELLGSG